MISRFARKSRLDQRLPLTNLVRAKRHKAKRIKWPIEVVRKARADWSDGKTFADLSRELCIPPDTIRAWCKKGNRVAA